MKARFCVLAAALCGLACSGGGEVTYSVEWGCDGDEAISDWLFFVEVTSDEAISEDVFTCVVYQGGDPTTTLKPRGGDGYWYAEQWEDESGLDCDAFDAITVECDPG